MLFNGQEIESLAMIDLVVRNEGASTIEGIEFTIEVDEQARILAIQPQPAPPGVTIGHLESDPSEWEVIIDYLNPMSLAKEQVRLAVFCEPEPDVVQAKGGGKGWSLDFLDQAELEARKAKSQRARAFILLAFTPVALLCIYAAMAFGRFVEDRFFPDPTQQWWQGILVLAAVCGVAVGLLWPLFKMVDVIMEDLAPFPE